MFGKKTKAASAEKPRKMPRKSWKSGRGALWVVAALLIGSAVVRLSGETGAAIAREMAQLGAGEDLPAEPLICETSEDLATVLAALQGREARLKEQEAILNDQRQALALARAQVEDNLTALAAAEAKLKSTLSVANTAAESDLERLTAMYENMKPKDAAALFEEMAPNFAAGFLARMRPDAAATVLAGLQPTTAYSISVILAGRNASVPTEN
jgi:flagellar motility protein MotE (MotC chaperone)